MSDRTITERSITGLAPVQDIICDRLQVVRKITVENTIDIQNDGKVFIRNLPTSEPTESGRLWNDNGTLKIKS